MASSLSIPGDEDQNESLHPQPNPPNQVQPLVSTSLSLDMATSIDPMDSPEIITLTELEEEQRRQPGQFDSVRVGRMSGKRKADLAYDISPNPHRPHPQGRNDHNERHGSPTVGFVSQPDQVEYQQLEVTKMSVNLNQPTDIVQRQQSSTPQHSQAHSHHKHRHHRHHRHHRKHRHSRRASSGSESSTSSYSSGLSGSDGSSSSGTSSMTSSGSSSGSDDEYESQRQSSHARQIHQHQDQTERMLIDSDDDIRGENDTSLHGGPPLFACTTTEIDTIVHLLSSLVLEKDQRVKLWIGSLGIKVVAEHEKSRTICAKAYLKKDLFSDYAVNPLRLTNRRPGEGFEYSCVITLPILLTCLQSFGAGSSTANVHLRGGLPPSLHMKIEGENDEIELTSEQLT